MRFLKVFSSQEPRRHLTGNREDRRPVPVGIVEPLDQMQVARPARSGARRDLPREKGLGAGRKSADFLISTVHPLKFSLGPPNGVGDWIDRITDESIDALNADFDHHFHNLIRCCL